ncbi:hypothetical protein CLM62_03570, partial [Streptomyces sp. SA15]
MLSPLSRFVPSGPELFGSVRSAALWLSGVPAALPVVGPLLRPRAPRLWRTPGGAQIEVQRLGRPGTAGAAREVEATLREMPGVYRAEVNGTLGCVYVGCGPDADLERVVALVSAADVGAPEAGTDGDG